MTRFEVGDVVYVDGASAILGDVAAVDEDGVTVDWRRTRTVEPPEDLLHAPAKEVPEADALLRAAHDSGQLRDTIVGHRIENYLASVEGQGRPT
jgi:hypothetical protein